MRVNSTHGKRLADDDYRRAIQIALDRHLIQVERASEVVPALVNLIPGLSAAWAYECSAECSQSTECQARPVDCSNVK
jgi:hypothetical protein